MDESTPLPTAATTDGPEGEDLQVAFDLGELPGGAKGAIEAVLMRACCARARHSEATEHHTYTPQRRRARHACAS